MLTQRLYLGIIAIFSTINTFTQVNPGPDIAWQQCFGGSEIDYFTDAILLENGEILASILSFSTDGDLLDIENPYGWVKKFSTSDYSHTDMFLSPPDCSIKYNFLSNGLENVVFLGGFTVLCDEGPDDDFADDFAVSKMNEAGEIVWTTIFGSTSPEFINGLMATPDGGVVLVGTTTGDDFDIPLSYPDEEADAVVAKLTADGAIEWIDIVGGSNEDLIVAAPVMLHDTAFQVMFSTNSSDYDLAEITTFGEYNFLIRNYHMNGAVSNENIIYSSENLNAAIGDLLALSNGNTLFAGIGFANAPWNPTYPEHDWSEGSIAIFNQDLELTDFKSFGGTSSESFDRIIYSQDSTCLYTLGNSSSNDGDLPGNHGFEHDLWIMKLDLDLNIVWSKNLGSVLNEFVEQCAIMEINNELVLFGKVTVDSILPSGDLECGSLGVGKSDAWIVRFDLTQEIESTSMIPTWQVYPNPASTMFHIEADHNLAANSYRVTIFNSGGIRMWEQDDIRQTNLIIQTAHWNSGLYFVHVQNEAGFVTNKMLFIQ